MKKVFLVSSVLIVIIGISAWWFLSTPDDTNPSTSKTNSNLTVSSNKIEEKIDKTTLPTPTASVTLEEKIGQQFIIGHWIGTPIASTTELITKHHLGGVIIMGNADSATNTKEWIDVWQEASEIPLIISVDQEGGSVTRYQGDDFIQTGQREITDSDTAYKIGFKRGNELATLGVNMNYSPVLDTANNPDSFMYQRVFANRADSASLASEMIKGMKASGVTGVVKHFPGHDDTSDDSHFTLPVVNIEHSDLDGFVLPFTEIIKNNPPEAIMTAHVLFPKIDPLPATLSKFFLTDYLRNQLGFSGVIITDDMSMDAIDTNWQSDEASVKSIMAGADIVLFAAEPEKVITAIDTVINATKSKAISEERITKSYERIMILKSEISKS